MPSDNFKDWVARSDIDFITAFIKAWIPFNAWYNTKYTDGNDREKINRIIDDISNNPIRSHIDHLMKDDGGQSQEFRSYLAGFHRSLNDAALEFDGYKLSFESVCTKNPKKTKTVKYRNCDYLAKRNQLGQHDYIACSIVYYNGSIIFDYKHSEFNIDHIKQDSNFLKLTSERQNTMLGCYNMIDPIAKFSALQEKRDLCDPKHNGKYAYDCDRVYFIRNFDDSNCPAKTVHKALIELLYLARNKLFHGELPLYESVQPVYKNAYFLLKIILEKLR